MVRINHELMRRKRLELGWTPENLAEESGLDPRTIRRIERGGSQTRLHSVLAIAQALNLKLLALVLDDPPGVSRLERNGSDLAAALAAADSTIQRELAGPGESSLKEALYVFSILLARILVSDGTAVGGNEEVDRVVTAFKASDNVIQTVLSGASDCVAQEATCVLSLLLIRYGTAFGRRSANALEGSVNFVQATCDLAKQALANYEVRK